MRLPAKILIAGVVLSIASVGQGQLLSHIAAKNISAKIRDCENLQLPPDSIDSVRQEIIEILQSKESAGHSMELGINRNEYIDAQVQAAVKYIELGLSLMCYEHNSEIRKAPKEKSRNWLLIAGTILTLSALPWLYIIVLPWSWNFLLRRIREVSKAITGK